MAVVAPPSLGHFVDGLGEIKGDHIGVLAAASVEVTGDGELVTGLGDHELTVSPRAQVGALVAVELPVTEESGGIESGVEGGKCEGRQGDKKRVGRKGSRRHGHAGLRLRWCEKKPAPK